MFIIYMCEYVRCIKQIERPIVLFFYKSNIQATNVVYKSMSKKETIEKRRKQKLKSEFSKSKIHRNTAIRNYRVYVAETFEKKKKKFQNLTNGRSLWKKKSFATNVIQRVCVLRTISSSRVIFLIFDSLQRLVTTVQQFIFCTEIKK